MSNKTRGQRCKEPNQNKGRSWIGAQDKLDTVNLYFKFGSTKHVAEELGISAATVRDRLYALGVELLPSGYSELTPSDVNDNKDIARLKLKLHIQAAKERGSVV